MTEAVRVDDLKSFLEGATPVFDVIPDAIRVIDPSGNTLYVNRAFLVMSGYSPTEVLSRSVLDLYVEEDRPRIQAAVTAIFKTGQWTGTLEARMRRKGGEPVMVSLNCAVIKNSKHEIVGGFAVFRDITRVERILTEPMELLKLSGSPVEVLRQLPSRVATFFPGRPWVMINLVEGNYLRFAYAVNVPADLMALGGEPLAGSICGIPIATRAFLGIGDMTADERTRQDPCVTQYGCKAYLGYPIIDSAGKVRGTICILRNNRGGFGEYDNRILQMFAQRANIEIERMELESRIDQSEKEMRELVEHAPVMCWRITPQGRVVLMSKKGLENLGYKTSEQIRESFFDLIHPDDLDEIKSKIETSSAKPGNGLFSTPVRLLKRDGDYGHFFTTVRPVFDPAGNMKLLEGVTFEIPADN